MAKLVVLTEGFAGLSLEVKPEKTTIGRVDDNQFCIAEPSVSSHHCEVWTKGDDIIVRDLHSTNGTFVNEVQVPAEKDTPVRPGQILRLGQVQIRHETGKRQSDSQSQRQTVKIGDSGQTIVVGKGSPFAKKSNNANKIFLAIGAVLVVVIIGSLVYVFSNLGSRP